MRAAGTNNNHDNGSHAFGNGAAELSRASTSFGNTPLPGRPTDFSVAGAFLSASLEQLAFAEKNRGNVAVFVDRTDLLSRVAIANVAAANGDLKVAAVSAGILDSLLKSWIQRAEKERNVPGLFEVLSTPGAVESMNLPAREKWPTNLTFEYWSSLTTSFKPAVVRAANGVPATPSSSRAETKVIPFDSLPPGATLARPARIAAAPSAPRRIEVHVLPDPKPKAKENTPTITDPVQYLRDKIAVSYTNMRSFIEYESQARGGHPGPPKLVPPLLAVRDAFFWQLFGVHHGDLEALRGNFPNERDFVKTQLAPFGTQPDSYFVDLHDRAIAGDLASRKKVLTGYPDKLTLTTIEERWQMAMGLRPPPKYP